MIRTIIWFIWFWISLILTIPFLLVAIILEKTNRNEERIRYVQRVTSAWARSQVWMSGSIIEVKGLENLPEGPVLYISNHQSNFDIPILMSYINRPKAFIAKVETSKLPFVHAWMKQMKCVFMDRKDVRQSVEAINQGVEYLRQGYSMVIFPEGTRSNGNLVGEFKAGSFKLATKSGVPVVPVAIKGSYKIMGKGSLIIKPAKVEVIILKPIEVSQLSKLEQKNIHADVQNIIQDQVG